MTGEIYVDPKMTLREFYGYVLHDRVVLWRLVTLIVMTALAVVAILSFVFEHWVLSIICFVAMVVICAANYTA